jgi:hypothetical protein
MSDAGALKLVLKKASRSANKLVWTNLIGLTIISSHGRKSSSDLISVPLPLPLLLMLLLPLNIVALSPSRSLSSTIGDLNVYVGIKETIQKKVLFVI